MNVNFSLILTDPLKPFHGPQMKSPCHRRSYAKVASGGIRQMSKCPTLTGGGTSSEGELAVPKAVAWGPSSLIDTNSFLRHGYKQPSQAFRAHVSHRSQFL